MSNGPTPLTVLTGFLGAGKTTLLNRIINGNHGLRIAVLVNDFGAINIDADLIVGVEDDVVSLANGCVCCTIRDDLVGTVLETLARPEAPEYLLLEASGVADPSGIAMTFVDHDLQDRVRLDSITCVIDADQVFAHPDYPAVEQLRLRQIGFADMVVLNKVDLVSEKGLDEARSWLADTFRRLRVVETTYCDVPLEILLSVGRFDGTQTGFSGATSTQEPMHDVEARGGPGRHDHGEPFSSWSYESTEPVSLDALREAIAKLPGTIYRVKGVLYTVEQPENRVVLQVVGRRVNVSTEGTWEGRERRTQIVAIGEPNGVDRTMLQEVVTACSVPDPAIGSNA